jgi:hypothetical protein
MVELHVRSTTRIDRLPHASTARTVGLFTLSQCAIHTERILVYVSLQNHQVSGSAPMTLRAPTAMVMSSLLNASQITHGLRNQTRIPLLYTTKHKKVPLLRYAPNYSIWAKLMDAIQLGQVHRNLVVNNISCFDRPINLNEVPIEPFTKHTCFILQSRHNIFQHTQVCYRFLVGLPILVVGLKFVPFVCMIAIRMPERKKIVVPFPFMPPCRSLANVLGLLRTFWRDISDPLTILRSILPEVKALSTMCWVLTSSLNFLSPSSAPR